MQFNCQRFIGKLRKEDKYKATTKLEWIKSRYSNINGGRWMKGEEKIILLRQVMLET